MPDAATIASAMAIDARSGDARRAAPGAERTDTIRHAFIDANHLRFHVALAGEGIGEGAREPLAGAASGRPLVVFLHGFPECWYSWRHQLRALAPHAACVAPDLRGYGDSDKPRSGYDLDSLADDVAALVRALGRERATIVGHDWGGVIAWHLAARRPEAVERVAILNAPPKDVLLDRILESPAQAARSWYIAFFLLPGLPELWLGADGAANVPRIFLGGARRRAGFTSEDLDVFRRALAKPGAVESALAYYRTAVRDSLDALRPARALGAAVSALARRLPAAVRGLVPGLPGANAGAPPRGRRRIACPGLVLWGVDDPGLGVELTYRFKDLFSGPFELRYIDGCGHWTQQEAPEIVNEALLRFIGATPGRRD